MKINPAEDSARMQAAVGVGVVRFLVEECDNQGGIITIDDIMNIHEVKYGVTLPSHIPANYADKLINDTVHIVMNVLLEAMAELNITKFNSSTMHMLLEKFTEARLYKIIKDSQGKDNDEEI